MEIKDILDNTDIRSENVQDIMKRPPHWMIRWGSAIILIIVMMILFIGWIIKYPEFVSAPIVVTSEYPPEKIVARTTSSIDTILVKNQQETKKNEILMVLKSTMKSQDLLKLKKIIDSFSPNNIFFFPLHETSKYKFGELQNDYNNFANLLRQEINRNQGISYNVQKIYSANQKSTLKNKSNVLINDSIQILQQFEQLRKSLKKWEHIYLIISSTEGKVGYQKFLRQNQIVNSGETLLYILPKEKGELVGTMKVPASNSGKILTGKKVLIKLDNYHFHEFGIIEGKVQNISFAPDEKGNYYVSVSLPKGLRTSYNKDIPFDKELIGRAEIITSDVRLLQRFFYQIREVIEH